MVKTVVNMIIVGIKNMITDRLLCLLIVQMKKITYIIRTCSHNFPFTYKRNLMSFIVHYQTWLEMHWKHVTAHLCWYRNTHKSLVLSCHMHYCISLKLTNNNIYVTQLFTWQHCYYSLGKNNMHVMRKSQIFLCIVLSLRFAPPSNCV